MTHTRPSPRGGVALTVRQPWASLLVSGSKDVENRGWQTRYRGRLWIHAGATVDPAALAPVDLPTRAILGSVLLTDVVRGHSSEWAQDGMWHWLVTDPRPLAVPLRWATGAPGLWMWSETAPHPHPPGPGRWSPGAEEGES